jgi:hypothetical protein
MNNEKGLLYLIQPAELVGTSRYKIGYSRTNDLNKFRKDYKKGSRFLDIYEYDHSPLLVREIRNNFNNKFKLVAGRTYYEGNENDIKKNFNAIINNHALANNCNVNNVNNSNNLLYQLCSKTSNKTNTNTCLYSCSPYSTIYTNTYTTNPYTTNPYTTNPYTTNTYTTNPYTTNPCSKNICNGSLANYAYMHNIMYGEKCATMKKSHTNPNKSCLYNV